MKADIMQSDRPSIPASKMDVMPVVEGSGWVYDVSHRDVVIDDDDFDNYGSGSGSGSGDEEDFDSEIGLKITVLCLLLTCIILLFVLK